MAAGTAAFSSSFSPSSLQFLGEREQDELLRRPIGDLFTAPNNAVGELLRGPCSVLGPIYTLSPRMDSGSC